MSILALSGLKPAVGAFLCFALTMSLVSLAAVGLAFLVSASVSSFAMANILIALPFVLMMVRGLRHAHTKYTRLRSQCVLIVCVFLLHFHMFRSLVVSLSTSMPC